MYGLHHGNAEIFANTSEREIGVIPNSPYFSVSSEAKPYIYVIL